MPSKKWLTAEPSRREAFARRITASLHDMELFDAFRDTPRDRFLPPDTPPALAYADTTISLGVGGINCGQPSLHAACLAALAPQPGETVVHAGAGTGYYTAILARLVGERGHVEAFEIEPSLAAQARSNLAPFPQVTLHAASATTGPLPACDIVYVNCGTTGPQEVWLEALRPHGRLLFPLTGAGGAGAMLLTQRPASPSAIWATRLLMPVVFIDCSGARDPQDEAAVTRAFQRGQPASVRWLHLGPPSDCPNEIWLAAAHWQLTK